jgi:hypothetical protein
MLSVVLAQQSSKHAEKIVPRSGGRVAGGLASYRLCQRETSLEMMQRFIVGPDDE